MRTETPWGPSQDETQITSGITLYETAGHGGFHLSPERHATVRAIFPGLETWAGGAWYEEDCDVAFPVAAFPETFTARQVFFALRTLRQSYAGRWASIADDAPALAPARLKAQLAEVAS